MNGAREGADLPYRALRNLRNAAWALPGPNVEPMVGLWAEQFNTLCRVYQRKVTNRFHYKQLLFLDHYQSCCFNATFWDLLVIVSFINLLIFGEMPWHSIIYWDNLKPFKSCSDTFTVLAIGNGPKPHLCNKFELFMKAWQMLKVLLHLNTFGSYLPLLRPF